MRAVRFRPRKRSAPKSTSLSSFRKGYLDGYDPGFNLGHEQGLSLGMQEGMSGKRLLFDGTSIIIPTMNQKLFLMECIESIRKYTSEPYEIIVIDNGSNDGTADYLMNDGTGIRFRLNDSNLGFAGAVNQGLQMAKGTTLLLLNNDTVVTPNWLSNLLACVNSDPSVGLVGPRSNYISGDQYLPTDYDSIEGMQQFAQRFNLQNGSLYQEVSRITGFCLMLRRDVFDRIGYFDEGFEIGNCEDDDYGLRATMLGLKLVIAGDTFVHHYGSMTMKTLRERFAPVYEQNQIYYFEKWGDPARAIRDSATGREGGAAAMTSCYPSHVVVKGDAPTAYWIENGLRHPISSPISIPITQLSRVDMNQWPVGPALSAEEVLLKLAAMSGNPQTEHGFREGAIVVTPDLQHYQISQGKRRAILSSSALRVWHLEQRGIHAVSDDLAVQYPLGFPIIPCPAIRTLSWR